MVDAIMLAISEGCGIVVLEVTYGNRSRFSTDASDHLPDFFHIEFSYSFFDYWTWSDFWKQFRHGGQSNTKTIITSICKGDTMKQDMLSHHHFAWIIEPGNRPFMSLLWCFWYSFVCHTQQYAAEAFYSISWFSYFFIAESILTQKFIRVPLSFLHIPSLCVNICYIFFV